MGLTFELTDVQVEQVNKWLEEHPCPVREHVERTRRLPAAGERMRLCSSLPSWVCLPGWNAPAVPA